MTFSASQSAFKYLSVTQFDRNSRRSPNNHTLNDMKLIGYFKSLFIFLF